MPNKSLKSIALGGMIWNAAEKVGVQTIQLIFGIVLARLLMPSDYGLIGMLTIFLAISQLFIDSGFSMALIQKKNRIDVDFSTVFYFNIFISSVFYILLFFTAQFIADFYGEPVLVKLTRILGLVIVISSLKIIQITKFRIDLNFKTLAKVNFTSILLSGVVGIILAYKGFGVWALVIQSLIRESLLVIFYWFVSQWRPVLEFSFQSFKQLFGFGSKLLGANLIGVVFQNIYQVTIGKFFSATDLGYYTKGLQFAQIPSGMVGSILSQVTFPILASLQDDKNRLVSVHIKLLRMTMFFIFPVMTIVALLSEPFIRFFLTEKWLPAAPLLQWFSFGQIILIISNVNVNILNATGRSDLYLKLSIYKILIVIVALIVTIPIGVKAMVIGIVASRVIAFFINAYYPGKLFNYGAWQQIKDMKLILLATFIMGVFVFLILGFFSSDVVKLIVGSFTGIVVYYLSVLVFRLPEVEEINGLLKENYLKFRKRR